MAETSPSQKSLKRLKRTCLEPLKPAKNTPKTKSLKRKGTQRTVVLDDKQLTINDYFTRMRTNAGVHRDLSNNDAPNEPNLEREDAV